MGCDKSAYQATTMDHNGLGTTDRHKLQRRWSELPGTATDTM